MVEGARLESVYTGNCIKGSNPFLSASKTPRNLTFSVFFYYIQQVSQLSLLKLKYEKVEYVEEG